jgi:hypothetical protein
MKYRNGKELVAKYRNGKACVAIYRIVAGVAMVVWEAIRSCFGKGYWLNERPWNNGDGWREL